MPDLAGSLESVRERIAGAARRAGRPVESVLLVAVTKGVSPARIAEAAALGVTDVGENRAQEMLAKQEALGARARALRWHFVGRLQRNKARVVVGRAAQVQSLDSVELAEEVSRRAATAGICQDALIEVNVSGEQTKAGVPPEQVEALAAEVAGLAGLRVRGFMTIAPEEGDPERARPVFRALRDLRDRLLEQHPLACELSMGMTGDFEIAVEEGATIVRIGRAIFGPREQGTTHDGDDL